MTDVLSREQIEEARQALLIATNNNPCANALCDMALSALDDAEDAERYRFIRRGDVTFETPDGPEFVSYTPELGHDGSNLDAAIDAARKENHD